MQGEGEQCLQTSSFPPSSPLTRLLGRACPSNSPSRTPQAGGLAALILPAALHEGIEGSKPTALGSKGSPEGPKTLLPTQNSPSLGYRLPLGLLSLAPRW